MLESVDLSLALDRKTYERRLGELQSELQPLQLQLSGTAAPGGGCVRRMGCRRKRR